MKTSLYLLMLTDGRPVMRLEELADLFNLEKRTLQNRVYAKKMPVPTFDLAGSTVAHVSDVAAYIDAQRDEATKLLHAGR